jgi:hypothetical protein
MKLIRSTLVLSLCSIGAAQTTSRPVLGWSFGADGQTVSTVFGVPGAGRIGPARRVPDGLSHLSMSPASNLAAAWNEISGAPALLNLETLEQTALATARPCPDSFVWSPGGSALALYYREQKWVQVFVLDSGTFQLKSELPLAADQIALSDSGFALLAFSENGLSLYAGNGPGIVATDDVSGFAFLMGSDVPAWWSAGNLFEGGAVLPFSKEPSEKVLLASPARGSLMAVRTGSGVVTILSADGTSTAEAGCDCPVSSVEALGRRGLIRLGPDPAQAQANQSDLLWVTSVAAGPRVFFIPMTPDGADVQ